MSFFDEVETTVANTRFLQAVEDSGPVKLSLQPFEELGQLSTALQNEVTLPHLLKPKTMGLYLFKQFLKEPLKEKSVQVIDRQVFLAFLEAVEEFTTAKTHERAAKGKVIYDTFLKYGGSRQAAANGLSALVLSIPEAEYDEDEGPETSQALREYEDDEGGDGSLRRRSRSATTEMKRGDTPSDFKKQDAVANKQVDVHLHLSSNRDSSTKRPSAFTSPVVTSTTAPNTPLAGGGMHTFPATAVTTTTTATATTVTTNATTTTTTNTALPNGSTILSSSTSTSSSSAATATTVLPAAAATTVTTTTSTLLDQGPPPPPPPPPSPSPPLEAQADTNLTVDKPADPTTTIVTTTATVSSTISCQKEDESRVVVPEYSKSDLPSTTAASSSSSTDSLVNTSATTTNTSATTTANTTTTAATAATTTASANAVSVTGKTPPPPPPVPSTGTTGTTTASADTTTTTTATLVTITATSTTDFAGLDSPTTTASTVAAVGPSSAPSVNSSSEADNKGDECSEPSTPIVSVKIDSVDARESKADGGKKSRFSEIKVSGEEPCLRTRLGSLDRPLDELSFGSLADLVKRTDKMDAILNDLVRYLALKPPPIETFNPIIDAFSHILQAEKMLDDFIVSPQWKRFVQLRAYVKKRMTLDHFRVFRVLGRGAFGAVSAVQKIDTHAIFAMKEMAKRQVKHQQSEWVCVNERKVLSKMKSPFVLNLKYSFHNSENMYLIFDMCSGGDLKFHLRNEKMRCFSLERSRFYAAEVLLGLEHIHSLNIVYRDLKPTNILLDEEGHCVISDLGLTVHLKKNKLIKHLAGTAGYWAPEILQKAGTYKTSDYWSFGVMLYEMILGRRPSCKCSKKDPQWCPFGQSRSMEQFALKEDGVLILDVDYPRELPADAVDLLKKLFEPNPEKRIGAKTGAAEIKAHPFFKSVDWAKLENKEITPPFKPDNHTVNANSIGEVGETNKAKYRKIKLLDEDEKHYEDFDFINMEALEAEMVTALIKMDAPPVPTKEPPKGSSNGSGCCVVS